VKKKYKSKKQVVFEIDSYLKKIGYTWINKQYYNGIHSICKIKCNKGHLFTIGSRSLRKGSFCKNCNLKSNYGENISRIILEELLGFELPLSRNLTGLVNPKTGISLEIDGFNEKNKLGFEYQGIQHFKFNKYLHKDFKNFKRVKKIDRIKIKYFKENNFKLLIIPQFNRFDLETIVEKVKKILVLNKCSFKDVSFEKIYEKVLDSYKSQKYYNVCKKEAEKNGFKIISGLFSSKKNFIILKKEKDFFKVKIDSIVKGNLAIKKASWTVEKAVKICKNYTNVKEFSIKEPSLYRWMISQKIYKQLTKHMVRIQKPGKNSYPKYSDEFLISKAKEFKTKIAFLKSHKTYYNLIIYRKLQKKAYSHIKT
jgi:hypothetical protein